MSTSLDSFEGVFEKLIEDIIEECALPNRVMEWFRKSLNHNTVGGKYNRGLSVIDTATILLDRPLTSTEFFETATLGWMVELFQAFMLVTDDIMDASMTRRGKSCWYLVQDVGMIAINDAVMIESCIYILLKKHFRGHSAYMGMMELFHEVSYKTEVGQSCDLIGAPPDANIKTFTLEQYVFIVMHKTAYYTFDLPIALALMYTQRATSYNLEVVRDLSLVMGEYFQVQDDFLDAYADPETLGKIGTDIIDNKCSWLILQAMERCTPDQMAVLEDNYGVKDPKCEAVVKALYRQLGLDQAFSEYEEIKVKELKKMIGDIDLTEGLRKEVFEAYLRKIYKRSK
ncbi:farnesyl pyrophosphate synthetase-like protein [Xylariales sp. PMI_506]|nr:farnesyl pyrophosphate synthetase-like protein [Xylariales sp. PMI_506]